MFQEIYQTALRAIVSVLVLFILTRLMGKRQMSQLTFFDYVAGISIGSIAAELAVNPSTGYTEGLTGLVIYAIFPILLAYISLKSPLARKLFDGQPIMLIQDGQILEKNLKKSKMNINDLLEECRLKDVFNISEIKYAIFETDGKLSLLLKSNQEEGPCTNVIIDGKIIKTNLLYLNKDESWVHTQLMNKGISNYSEVLLAFLDSNQQLHIHLKNETLPSTATL